MRLPRCCATKVGQRHRGRRELRRQLPLSKDADGYGPATEELAALPLTDLVVARSRLSGKEPL